MKTKHIVLASLGLLAGLASCNQISYDGEYQHKYSDVAPRTIYFLPSASNLSVLDTLRPVALSDLPASKQDTTCVYRVRLSGLPADKDLTFRVVADPSSTAVAGEHYQLGSDYQLKKDSIDGSFSVKILRSKLSQEPGNDLDLVLRLEPTNDFKVRFTTDNKIRLRLSNYLTEPEWFGNLAIYFGGYSVKKYSRILEVFKGTPRELQAVVYDFYNGGIQRIARIAYDLRDEFPEGTPDGIPASVLKASFGFN